MMQNCVLVIIIDLGPPRMYVGYPESKFWSSSIGMIKARKIM
jgi:hypothetical protein